MVRISWDLIRKKTEHHDGLLTDLEEISLHQLNIEKLEVIGRVCPRLKILYLQNNLISRIENIKRLKSLVYLNLALNNLADISEEIAHCEKLRKLDLTVNFIDVDCLASSIDALVPLVHLDELYLTGNPCTAAFPAYRAYIIHRLPRLEKLDGVDVTRGERIQAKAAFLANSMELSKIAEEKRREKAGKAEEAAATAATAAAEKEKRQSGKDDDDEAEEKEALEAASASASSSSAASVSATSAEFAAKSQKVSAYTPESRLEMHRESEALELAKAAQKKKEAQGAKADDPWNAAQAKLNSKVVLDGSETEIPRQRNMGKWDFLVSDSKDGRAIVVDIEVQRFLDTSLIDVDVHPLWFQVIIKGKNLLLHFPAEVSPSETKVQRIQANGHLLLTCPKVLKTTAITSSSGTGGAQQRAAGADEDEDAADAEMDRALAASEAASTIKSSVHSNVIDLTTAASRSAAAASSASSSSASSSTGPSAFTFHNSGGSLNQVVADYRHITKKKAASTAAAPEIKELTATRSATLEEAQRERARAAQQEKQRSVEAERVSLEKLGLDDSGVPDLE